MSGQPNEPGHAAERAPAGSMPAPSNEPRVGRGDSRRRHRRIGRRTRHDLARIAFVLLVMALFALLVYLGEFLDALP